MFENNKEFIEAEFGGAADVCRNWPGFEKYADPLEKFKVLNLIVY